jgi:hypothetical protein
MHFRLFVIPTSLSYYLLQERAVDYTKVSTKMIFMYIQYISFYRSLQLS